MPPRRWGEGSVLDIRPKHALRIRRITHDPELVQETYDAGRQAAEEQMDRIREFMGQKAATVSPMLPLKNRMTGGKS